MGAPQTAPGRARAMISFHTPHYKTRLLNRPCRSRVEELYPDFKQNKRCSWIVCVDRTSYFDKRKNVKYAIKFLSLFVVAVVNIPITLKNKFTKRKCSRCPGASGRLCPHPSTCPCPWFCLCSLNYLDILGSVSPQIEYW